MRFDRTLPYLAIALAFIVIGFIGSLALHWGIRPDGKQNQALQARTEPKELSNLSYTELSNNHLRLKTDVAELEARFSEAEVKQNINEGRARAIILELQTYRDERNRLFEDLERRKQKMREKIEELDTKISDQISQRAEQETERDVYDVTNEMTSLLSYPHPLNDQAELNAAMIAQPIANHELAEQRFELMLQLTDYTKQDAILESLQPIIEQMNKTHNNNSEITLIQCSASQCEVQTSFIRTEPYFDYWQQWQDLVQASVHIKQIQHHFHTQVGDQIIGIVLVSL